MVFKIIKEVSIKDLIKIVNLEKKIFKQNAFTKDLIRKLIKTNIFFLKLEIGRIHKKLIGFIIVVSDAKDKVNIINLLIKSKYQNKGYGSYLLQKTIDKIRNLNIINHIILNVQISNSRAIRLYEKFNFKRDPNILDNYYQSGESAFLMDLDIAS